ncbi:MAG: DUF3298 and DUF4163 domain-containing protein [Limnochordia bacterium]|jgi:hypothetical protein
MANWTKVLVPLTIILAVLGAAQGHFAGEPGVVQVITKTVREDLDSIEIDLYIPVIEGMTDKALQTKINRQLEDRIMSFSAELASEAERSAEELKETNLPFRRYQAYTRFDVYGNDKDILSLPITFYQYTGGAHGLSFIESTNIDLESGKQLTLTDFLTGADRQEILMKAIREQIAAAEEDYFPESLNLTALPNEGDFYLEGDQLVVYYDSYEIAPYATGIPAFKIPLSLLD